MKRFISLSLVLICVASILCGCSEKEKNSPPKFDFDKIEWSVDSGFSDNERRNMLLSLKNNSKFKIADLSFYFDAKKGITEEEEDEFYKLYLKRRGLDYNDTEEINQVKRYNNICVYSKYSGVIYPGNKVKNLEFSYCSGFFP